MIEIAVKQVILRLNDLRKNNSQLNDTLIKIKNSNFARGIDLDILDLIMSDYILKPLFEQIYDNRNIPVLELLVKIKDNLAENHKFDNLLNKYHLIDHFFIDQNDYITFLVDKKERMIVNDEMTCSAELKKVENEKWSYVLTQLNGEHKYIGDYIIPFKASKENIDIFNKGCKIKAERLAIYIETNDIKQVPNEPSAFGNLTFSE